MIQSWFCNCQQNLCLFHIVVEYIPGIHDQGKMLVHPKSTSLLSTFHIGSMFWFFPANLMSSTYTDKNNPFSRCTNKHSQLETFSQPYFNKDFLKLPFPEQSCQRMTAQISLSRRTTGSSILDHDFGHLCRGRRIQNVWSNPIWEFSIILGHLPFFNLGLSRYTASAACPAHPGSLDMISMTFAARHL